MQILKLGVLCVLLSACTAQLNKNTPGANVSQDFLIDPLMKQIAAQEQVTFKAMNGVQPYQYRVHAGGGSIDSSSGVFQAPDGRGTSIISVRDAGTNMSYATVIVYDKPQISKASLSLAPGNSFIYSVTGGVAPYSYSILSGGGTLNAAIGIFTAPNQAGVTKIRVTDAAGNISDSVITVNARLGLTPKNQVVAPNSNTAMIASGGVPPYSFQLISGNGAIDATTGNYNAPILIGTDVVRVEDSLGNIDYASITVSSSLQLGPVSSLMAQGTSGNFVATGGQPPYVYSAQAGVINPATGAFTAPATPGGPYTVTVSDASGASATAEVTITTNLSFSSQNISLPVNGTFDFASITNGGVGAKTYVVAAAHGVFVGSMYTAPATTGTYKVTVYDSQTPSANSAEANITVNPELQVTPSSSVIAVKNTQGISVNGGVPPYTYSVVSGAGTFESGVFTAGNSAGSVMARVTDSYGSQKDISITVNAALKINPISTPVAANGQIAFTASGGVGNYTFSLLSGLGSVNPDSGIFTAPSAAGTAVVEVSDELGNKHSATVSVVAPLIFSPSMLSIHMGSSIILGAQGGLAPYSYSMVSGSGSVDSSTGKYQSLAEVGSAVIRVTDSLGSVKDITVNMYDSLLINPVSSITTQGQSVTFTATGGELPYTYSILSGAGVISSGSGVYVAPMVSGTETIRVTDALGNTSDSQIIINPPLSIAPLSAVLAVNNTKGFQAAGGVPPYNFSLVSGDGTISRYAGDFVAANSAGSVVVRITDAVGSTADANITVNSALSISPSRRDLGVNSALTLSSLGGVPPYVYSLSSGQGSIGASSGIFTAAAVPGSDIVRVTDSLGNYAESSLQTFSAPIISPLSKVMVVNGQSSFSVSGGKAPYTYAVNAGSGTVTAQGIYTAGATSGTSSVTVTDDLGQSSTASLTINNNIAISPLTAVLAAAGTQNFSATGGVPPYSYYLSSGPGSISGAQFSAPSVGGGTSTILVSDSMGNMASATVTSQDSAPLSLSYTLSSAVYQRNTAITANSPTYTGGTPTSYSVSPALPAGLSLNTSSGLISGTPSSFAASATYTITGSNVAGSAQVSLTIAVNDLAPMALSYIYSPVIYTKGSAIVNNTPSSSGGAVVTYSVSPSLPAGLSLNTSTGVISGTPSALATSRSYTVTATNTGGSTSASVDITVRDAAPSSLVYSSNPAVYTKNSAIASNSPSSGGGAVVSYSVSPSLPAGLSLNSTTGVISGTPSVAVANASYTITATNTGGSTTAVVAIKVNDLAPTNLSYTRLSSSHYVNVVTTNNTPSNTGGVPESYSISPALPAGMVLNTATGVISGKPTVLSASTNYTVTAQNGSGSTTRVISIEVTDAPPSNLIYSSMYPIYTEQVAITPNSPSSSGGPVVSYSIFPALPAGLSLNTSTGVISGTPSFIEEPAEYTVTASNTGGSTTAILTLEVRGAAITSIAYANPEYVYQPNVAMDLQRSAKTGGTITWCSVSPSLPSGMSIQSSSCRISGTPTGTGGQRTTYTVTAGNSGGSASTTVKISIYGSTRMWYWKAGDKGVNINPNWGTKGVAAATNQPGSRVGSRIDYDPTNKVIWLYGGNGVDGVGFYSDLWKYDGTNWIWVHGVNTTNTSGVYGTKNVADANNRPGARINGISWVLQNGDYYLFGGYGYDKNGTLGDMNDLWKFDGTNWTWVGGNSTANTAGSYGAIGAINANNLPDPRGFATVISKNDRSGIFMFGGQHNSDFYNDLWKWSPTDGWVLMSGGNTVNKTSVAGVKNSYSSTYYPGGRRDSYGMLINGNPFIYGGVGYSTSAGTTGYLADGWIFTGTSWGWGSGDLALNAPPVYGTKGVVSSANHPGARERGATTVSAMSNQFYIFGGYGFVAAGQAGYMNDLWSWDGTNWVWLAGDDARDKTAVYGTKGELSSSNSPGARGNNPLLFKDAAGNLNILFGRGYSESGPAGPLNDWFTFVY